MKKKAITAIFLLCLSLSFAQLLQEKNNFTRQDSLRGSITPEREWWDLIYYHLDIEVKPDEKFISGKNTVQQKVLKPHNRIQIDLQSPLQIEKVIQNGKELSFTSEMNAHFINLVDQQEVVIQCIV